MENDSRKTYDALVAALTTTSEGMPADDVLTAIALLFCHVAKAFDCPPDGVARLLDKMREQLLDDVQDPDEAKQAGRRRRKSH